MRRIKVQRICICRGVAQYVAAVWWKSKTDFDKDWWNLNIFEISRDKEETLIYGGDKEGISEDKGVLQGKK